ncbi:MFS transporter [Oceanithermus sp.]|uniref:MFS transporter n=1 Tax=Oceanithermus sp. TaxID=2268145 RepID=UPI0025796A4B|nr:MFS transporter [Oceanithermus sp.]
MRAVWNLHLATFLFFLAYGLTVPTLPLYLKAQGLGAAWIGWAVALMPLAGLALRPFGGWASDGWSRKKPSLIGLGLGALSGLFYLGPLGAVLAGRFLQGAAMALFAPSSLAITSDLVPEHVVGRVMGTRNLILGIGVMSGTALGGFVVDLYGFSAVWLLVLLVQLVWIPFFVWGVPETLDAPSANPWWANFGTVLRDRGILAPTLANTGFAAVFATLQTFYPLVLSEAGFRAAWVGAFLAFYSLVSVFFRLPAGYLADRFEAGWVALAGFASATLGLFLLWVLPLPPFAFAAGFFMGAGAGLYLPANIVAVTRAARPELRGSAFSLFTASWDLGGLVGPPVGGAVAAALGLGALFPLMALGALLTVLVFVWVRGGGGRVHPA